MNNLSDNISDFSAEQYKGLAEWRDFYKESKVGCKNCLRLYLSAFVKYLLHAL